MKVAPHLLAAALAGALATGALAEPQGATASGDHDTTASDTQSKSGGDARSNPGTNGRVESGAGSDKDSDRSAGNGPSSDNGPTRKGDPTSGKNALGATGDIARDHSKGAHSGHPTQPGSNSKGPEPVRVDNVIVGRPSHDSKKKSVTETTKKATIAPGTHVKIQQSTTPSNGQDRNAVGLALRESGAERGYDDKPAPKLDAALVGSALPPSAAKTNASTNPHSVPTINESAKAHIPGVNGSTVSKPGAGPATIGGPSKNVATINGTSFRPKPR